MTGGVDGARLGDVLARASCDALIASAPENVTYATRAAPFLMYAFAPANPYKEETFALVRADGATTLVAATEAVPYLAERAITADALFCYGDARVLDAVDVAVGEAAAPVLRNVTHAPTAFDALVAAVGAAGLTHSRLAVDSTGLTAARSQGLRERLPGASIREGAEVFRALRAVKREDEVTSLVTVLRILERAMAEAFDAASTGVAETDLERIVRARIAGEGAQPGHYETTAGRRASAPFPPSGYVLQPGDVLRSDCGARLDGYWADTGRSVAVGDPDPLLERAYEALRAGVAAMIAGVRAGVPAGDVAKAGIETVRTHGIPSYDRAFAGHGIGLELYEPPLLRPDERTQLEAGMVVNVELPHGVPGVGGLQIEETLLVTADGCAVLTDAPRELRRVPAAI